MRFQKSYLISFLFVCNFFYAQDFEKVDNTINFYPANFSTIDDLALRISSDFSNPSEKARAAFYWICKNISYDTNFSKKIEFENLIGFSYKTDKEFIAKEKKFIADLALTTFNSKTAICHGYSALYASLANKLGLECKLIRGNLKFDPSQIGAQSETNHAWNVVKIDNQWKFIDCTLGAGNVSSKTGQFVFSFNDSFFFTEPKLFFLNHFPEDEKWLLLSNKSKSDYINLPLYFPNFLKNEAKLTLPQTGNISNTDIFEIKLSDFNAKDDYVEYKFTNDARKTAVEFDSGSLTYTVSVTNRANESLLLFLNGKLTAIYNIVAK